MNQLNLYQHEGCLFHLCLIASYPKISPESLLPFILVPTVTVISTINKVSFATSHLFLLAFIYYYYQKILIWRPQTKVKLFYTVTKVTIAWIQSFFQFFFHWSIFQTLFLAFIYEIEVIGVINLPKTITFLENLLLATTFTASLTLAHKSRQMALKSNPKVQKDRIGKWCRSCEKLIEGRGYHCAWIDACVSPNNQAAFVSFLVFAFLTLLQAGNLMLTSVCETQLIWGGAVLIPRDCTIWNEKFLGNSSLVFVAGVQCWLISMPTLGLILTVVWNSVKSV